MNLYRSINISILFSLLFFSAPNSLADNIEAGEKLFKQNCTACHSMTTARLVGPGLEGVTDKYEKEWLIKWIRNSQELIASGDERAIAIYEEYNKVAMTAFDFSDQEFSDLLAYLANPPIQEEKNIASTTDVVDQGMSASTQFMIIALVLVTLVFMLVSLKNNLKSALGQETETIPETLISQYSKFISNNINVVFLCAVVAIVMLKFTYDGLMGVGVTTNYAPAQPIAFSHKVHA